MPGIADRRGPGDLLYVALGQPQSPPCPAPPPGLHLADPAPAAAGFGGTSPGPMWTGSLPCTWAISPPKGPATTIPCAARCSTFGWCSEREMAFGALMAELGVSTKIKQEGIHVWSEMLVSPRRRRRRGARLCPGPGPYLRHRRGLAPADGPRRLGKGFRGRGPGGLVQPHHPEPGRDRQGAGPSGRGPRRGAA